MANPDPKPDPNAPQVLLFGHSGSGKSSLLAALVRAGETQGETLQGDVQESSGRLFAIRDAVYRGGELTRSDTELASYTIRIRPWRAASIAVAKPQMVVLHDCSGRAAEGLIRRPSALRDSDARAPIARAVIEADAIMLLADATSDDEELHEAFEEFDTFLTVVAQGKASARDVGGFPILLVLSKCDHLVQPGDTREQWELRVQRRAERAWKQFDAFLKDADPDDGIPSPFLPFGSIDLTVYTVAIREPVLAEAAPQSDTPYQVAELFRDCFEAARTHRERVSSSNVRLRWTVRTALAIVTTMLLGMLAVSLYPPAQGSPDLAQRVLGYARHEPEAAVRLGNDRLATSKRLLESFHGDPAFSTLPEDLRDYVVLRLREIEDYEAYRVKLEGARAPGDTRTLEELGAVEDVLTRGDLSLPQIAWAETPAGQLRSKWLADAKAIRATETQLLERYLEYIRRETALLLASSLGGSWRADATAVAAESAVPPLPLTEPVSGSPRLDQPRGQPVLNRVPFEFERVYNARRECNAVTDRLTRMRDLADALGLTAGPDRPAAVLVLPEPAPPLDSAAIPASRLFALRPAGDSLDRSREWELHQFPQPGRGLLAEQLDRSLRIGVRHVQALLRERIAQNPKFMDTPLGWQVVADQLADPALADWGRLLQFLMRLQDPVATDPTTELAAFLRKRELDLDLRGFELILPADLAFEKVTPSGPLRVTVTPPAGPAITREFKPSSTGTRVDSGTRYRFSATDPGKITYHPGDELRVEVPLKAGAQEMKLVWEAGTTRTFQFDRFAREPRLVKPAGTEAATGVRLTPTSDSVVPKLPVLLPDLRK